MGIFRKMRSVFHDDWCNLCQSEMDVLHRQLYALPDMTVDHYTSHDNPDYYRNHLIPVEKKAQIPAGVYACGLHVYRCPVCGHRRTKLTTFLPVRDQEKMEEILFFDHGELDGLVYQKDMGFAGFPDANGPEARLGKNGGLRQDSADRKTCGPYGYE